MANYISKNCNITFDEARYVITNLKRTKKINKPIQTANKINDFFNITFK